MNNFLNNTSHLVLLGHAHLEAHNVLGTAFRILVGKSLERFRWRREVNIKIPAYNF